MKNFFILNRTLKSLQKEPLVPTIETIYKTILDSDKLVGYINSPGGYLDSAWIISFLIGDIKNTIVFGGSQIDSASLLVFSSFKKRIAFSDSLFTIHHGSFVEPRKKSLLEEDTRVWNFISGKIKKISPEDLNFLADKEKILRAEEAREIGLVNKIISPYYKKFFADLKTGAYCY